MSSTRLARRSSGRSRGELVLLPEAALSLIAARLIIGVLPFRFAVRLYRLRRGTGPALTDPERADQIGWAVRAMAARLPWTSTCLMQSIAGAVLLRRRRLGSTVQLGVARAPTTGSLVAHSWLICGDQVLTGAVGRDRFTPVASYFAGR